MAKQTANLSETLSQIITKFNTLVDQVGDLNALNPAILDSNIVSALNASLSEGGTDSAAVVSILDSAGYVAFGAGESDGNFVKTSGAQNIGGEKTFTSDIQLELPTPEFRMYSTTRDDSSSVYEVELNDSGVIYRFVDSVGVQATKVFEVNTDLGERSSVSSIDFYTGTGTLTYSMESDGADGANETIINQLRGDARYIRQTAGSVSSSFLADSSVTQAKLANNAVGQVNIANDAVGQDELASVVSLVIYDSTGSAVKTLYGAGA